MVWIEHEKHVALGFIINGMDATLEKDLQTECIRYVEHTFDESDEVYQFVHQRFLSKPPPEGADIDNALRYARTDKVRELYIAAKQLTKE